MRAWWFGGLLLGACAGAAAQAPPTAPSAMPTGSASAAPSAAESPAPAASASSVTSAAPGPVPTGGSVLLGEIAAPKGFDPTPTLVALQPKLVACYNQARASNSSLHGKVKLRVEINEVGSVLSVSSEAGGSANDPTLVACVGDGIKAVSFPKPRGTATLIVPMVFRP